MPLVRHVWASCAIAALLAAPLAASAQQVESLLGKLQGAGSGSPVLDAQAEARAVETAEQAFEGAAARVAKRLLEENPEVSDGVRTRLRGLASDAAQSFGKQVREELGDAKGDGLLTRQELTEEIGEARERALDELTEALQAAVVGAVPPPQPGSSRSTAAYAREMTRYVFVERNAPIHWLTLGGWLLGAMAAVRVVFWLSARLGLQQRVSVRLRRPLAIAREPLYLVAGAAGLAVGRSAIWLPVAVQEALETSIRLLAGVGLVWLWWRLSQPIGRRIAGIVSPAGRARDEATDVARKVLRLVGAAALSLLIARSLFDADLSTLLAGIGVAGIAASVAAQDTLRNLMASVTIHGDRPFAPTELIRFQDHLGTIEEVGFRSTRLRTLDGPLVVIPNAELVRESVENLSARTYILHQYAVDLVYGTTAEQMREAVEILEEILGARAYPAGREPHVAFDRFGDYSLRIELWYTSDTGDYFEAKRHRTEVNLEILQRFGKAGLEFAFPTRTVHIEGESLPEAAPLRGEDPEAD